ncbi:MAG: hypothetical protein J6T73_04930, partial [Clostridia bacterium]|nr:hypothetical protein [Clostridia bacterium]
LRIKYCENIIRFTLDCAYFNHSCSPVNYNVTIIARLPSRQRDSKAKKSAAGLPVSPGNRRREKTQQPFFIIRGGGEAGKSLDLPP